MPEKSPHNQMLINYVPGEECRVAVLEDGRLEEFHSERAGAVSFVGNIYVGRVVNVEASIQAAFIDFGLESNGFLHVSDVHPMYFPGEDKSTTEQIGRKTPRRERPPIQHCLRRGQEVVVQVLKEGINTKGPTLTSYISIPGRYLVMLPDMDRVGVSRKVEDEDLRREMRQVLDTIELPEGFGFIMRTAGEGRGKMELKRDLAYLQRLWKDIERRRKMGDKPRLLYAESDLMMRALRDIWTTDIHEIVIDNEAALDRASRFMKIVAPRSSTKLLHYDRTAPLFHAFGVEEQINLTHAREVPLPSGGSLVFDETEAMIAIDVNSGKSRSANDSETNAYRTNLEAVDEICRQLRLRDAGGLVLCDLIDMMRREHRRDIEHRFRDRLKRDRAASKTLPISEFGIVEMTRQRQKQSLRATHYAKCPSCVGRGVLKRPDSVADDAMRELAAVLEHEKVGKVELVVSPRVAGELLSHKRQSLGRLERTLGKHVDVRVSEDIPVDRVALYAYDGAGADVDVERLPRPRPPRDLPVWEDHTGAGSDWSVDVRLEHAAEPEDAAPLEPDVSIPLGDDLMLAEDLSDFDQAGEGAAGDVRDGASEGGRRKRRRRRRGRGKAGEGEASAHGSAPQPAAARAPAASRPDQPQGEGAGDGAELDETGATGGRRRRRRRRRGRGREADAPIAGQTTEELPPVDPSIPRGDSWDLAPSAVVPLSAGAGRPGALVAGTLAPQDAAADEDLDDAGGERQDHRAEAPHDAHQSEQGEDDADDDRADEPGDPASGEGEGSGEQRPKRRRRRRGRRGRGAGTTDAEGEPGGSTDRQRATGGDRPPAARPTASKPPPAKPSTRAPAPAPVPAPAPAKASAGDAAPKPQVRTLYGNRRRLKPSEAASAKARDE